MTRKLNIPADKVAVSSRFKPGVSGNPAGRPKSKPLTLSHAYARQLAKVDEVTGQTYAALIAEQIVKHAASGDVLSVMVALSNDNKELVKKAVHKLMRDAGCTRAQAERALSLFVPQELI